MYKTAFTYQPPNYAKKTVFYSYHKAYISTDPLNL